MTTSDKASPDQDDERIIKFTLRLPEELHRRLALQAQSNFRSLHGEVLAILTNSVPKE